MAKKRSLAHFESIMKQLFEGSFRRMIGDDMRLHHLVSAVLAELETGHSSGKFSSSLRIDVSSEDFRAKDLPLLEQGLAELIHQYAEDSKNGISDQVFLDIHITDRLSSGQCNIEPGGGGENTATVALPLSAGHSTSESVGEREAFLIIDGQRHFPINRPLITIGRFLDNDIVIDLKSVSRQHAQIRWRMEEFMIYDLDSGSGTFVNDNQIKESILRPGDVIKIAETTLIFGEGRSRPYRNRSNDYENGGTKPLPSLDNL